MKSEIKERTTNELIPKEKNQQDALLNNLSVYEFARIYYDGP
jgi:hypothetical protein